MTAPRLELRIVEDIESRGPRIWEETKKLLDWMREKQAGSVAMTGKPDHGAPTAEQSAEALPKR